MNDTRRTFDVLVAKLDAKQLSSGWWAARCPAHDDHNPSFNLALTDDGVILLNCHAGCDKRAILDGLGLDW